MTVGLPATAIFSIFSGYCFRNFRDKARVIIVDTQSLVGFSMLPKCMNLNECDLSSFVLTLASDASMSISLPCLAYITFHYQLRSFLSHDATQSAVMPQYIIHLSVCPSVTFRYVFHISWNLEYFENNFMAE